MFILGWEGEMVKGEFRVLFVYLPHPIVVSARNSLLFVVFFFIFCKKATTNGRNDGSGGGSGGGSVINFMFGGFIWFWLSHLFCFILNFQIEREMASSS